MTQSNKIIMPTQNKNRSTQKTHKNPSPPERLNLLSSLQFLISNYKLSRNNVSSSKATNGTLFEVYCKSWLSQTPIGADKTQAQEFHDSAFCFSGKGGSFPDACFRGVHGGDAFEFKETASVNEIQLNSSLPKSIINSSVEGINAGLKKILEDEELSIETNNNRRKISKKRPNRNLFYIIGHTPGCSSKKSGDILKIKSLWIIDSTTIFHKNKFYEEVFKALKNTIKGKGGIIEKDYPELFKHLEESKEIGRLNLYDPIGISSLRVRGMNIMKHPSKIFEGHEIVNQFENKDQQARTLYCLISENRWSAFPKTDRNFFEDKICDTLGNNNRKRYEFKWVKIKNPRSRKNGLIKVALIRWHQFE